MLPSFTAENEPVHQFSVDADVELLLPSEPASVARVVLLKTYPDPVFAVYWKGMADSHTAARAQGQIFTHPHILALGVVGGVAE